MHDTMGHACGHNASVNVGQIERWASGVGGLCLAVYGVSSRDSLMRFAQNYIGDGARRGWLPGG